MSNVIQRLTQARLYEICVILKLPKQMNAIVHRPYDGVPPKATFVFQRMSKWKNCKNENAKISE